MDPAPGTIVEILDFWKISFVRIRTDLAIAGSPEQCLSRTVVEDDRNRLFLLEKISLLGPPRKNMLDSPPRFIYFRKGLRPAGGAV